MSPVDAGEVEHADHSPHGVDQSSQTERDAHFPGPVPLVSLSDVSSAVGWPAMDIQPAFSVPLFSFDEPLPPFAFSEGIYPNPGRPAPWNIGSMQNTQQRDQQVRDVLATRIPAVAPLVVQTRPLDEIYPSWVLEDPAKRARARAVAILRMAELKAFLEIVTFEVNILTQALCAL